jgi:hypothetical protein
MPEEIINSLKNMNRGKAPGQDNITIDLLKDANHVILQPLCKLYNCCLEQENIPTTWRNAQIILLHKKAIK